MEPEIKRNGEKFRGISVAHKPGMAKGDLIVEDFEFSCDVL
jgi:hypothetical protein